MIKVYIRNCGALFMSCIFGLDFHEPICPCQLLGIDNSELDNLVCTTCENKLKSDYLSFSAQERDELTGDFRDFISVLIEKRLMHLRSKRNELESGSISKLEPFGETLSYGLSNARIDVDGKMAWVEEDTVHHN